MHHREHALLGRLVERLSAEFGADSFWAAAARRARDRGGIAAFRDILGLRSQATDRAIAENPTVDRREEALHLLRVLAILLDEQDRCAREMTDVLDRATAAGR